MQRLTFTVRADELEDVLDGFIHLLPRGVRTSVEDGTATVEAIGPALPETGVPGATRDEVPADFQLRRPPGGIAIGGRVLIRSPHDEPREGLTDVVVAWEGQGFGSGTHPTTRMCAELLLEVEPREGLTDVGCGIGTLALVAAALGFTPVTAVDRDEAAVAQARRNIARNGAGVTTQVLDVETSPLHLEAAVVVNAPPAVHARVAHALGDRTRTVVASGFTSPETAIVVDAYEAAGLVPAVHRTDEDGIWGAMRLERRG